MASAVSPNRVAFACAQAAIGATAAILLSAAVATADVGVMGLRAAAVQFGYLLGAAAGGAALATGGYSLLGATLGALFLLGVAPHLRPRAGLHRPANDAIPALASDR